MPNPGNTTAQQSIIDMPITPLHHSSVSYRKKKYSENEKRKLVDRDEVNADHSTEDTSEKTKGTLIANGVTNNINKSVDHEAEWKTIGNEDNNIEDEFPRSKKKKRKNMLMQSGESPFHPELNEEKNKVIVNENDNNIQEFVGPEIKNKDTLNEPDKDIEQRVPKRNKSKKKKNSPMNYMDLEETVPKRKKKKEESVILIADCIVTDKEENERTSALSNIGSNRKVCEGDLASYTKKQPVPMTTDEYLKEKKINIVRIDYITSKDIPDKSQCLSSKSNTDIPISTPKVSLTTNTLPIKFASELTCIKESNSVDFQKEICTNSTDIIVNSQDKQMACEPPDKCPDRRIENKQNGDSKDSKQESVMVSEGTEFNNAYNNIEQNPIIDIKTPQKKEYSYKEVSPLSESMLSFLARYDSNMESTQSIKVDDVHEKSPFVSGCHWIQSENRTVKHKELCGVGRFLENLKQTPKVEPQIVRQTEAQVTEEIFDVESFVTLRKRKRSRRRPKKNRFENDDSVTLPPKTIPMPKLMISQGSPNIHIKFCDDENEDSNKDKPENQENSNAKHYRESQSEVMQKAISLNDMVPKDKQMACEPPDKCPDRRIENKQNIDPKDSEEESGMVSGGTKFKNASNNIEQNSVADIKNPEEKENSFEEVSPLIDDVYGKSPFASGCHWIQSENQTAKPKELSGVGNFLEILKQTPKVEPQIVRQTEPHVIDVFDVESFVALRQRKMRSRRPKKNRFESDDCVIPKTIPVPKPVITQGSSSIHVKVCVDENEVSNNDRLENHKNSNGKGYLESQSQVTPKAIPVNDMAPKVGNVIAFKVLKMSENYTPEVSAQITGKVVDYNPSDGSVKFDIIAGLDELKEPNGKLFIAENDDVKQNQNKEFKWNALIEPRLFN
ncbi:unnamed protein product [Acanthoscelides obtectus]|uniref:Coilin tudor domain-containing protein n=1 Tax=Acanthoscelides obtectus TaxID=200917 RepID=A0A9P0LTQ2_ACAOB|nr:unnamed protein product [Acanthoscelides obtectus]CAK1648231.1 Coilin [Acanthoscelides obtectus]